MSINFDTSGAIVMRSSGTGSNANTLTLNVPTSLSADRSIGMYEPSSNSNLQFGIKQVVVVSTSPVTLTAAQSGSIVSIRENADSIILPAAATSAGVEYDLIVSGTVVGNVTVTTAGGFISGVLLGAAVPVLKDASTSIGFDFTEGRTGDRVRFSCDGLEWYVVGNGSVDGCFT